MKHCTMFPGEVVDALSPETQNQAEWSSKYPHLVEDVLAHCKEVGPLKSPSKPDCLLRIP